jgi:hypothetical protein
VDDSDIIGYEIPPRECFSWSFNELSLFLELGLGHMVCQRGQYSLSLDAKAIISGDSLVASPYYVSGGRKLKIRFFVSEPYRFN